MIGERLRPDGLRAIARAVVVVLGVLCLTGVAAAQTGPVGAAAGERKPSGRKQCATCHVSWPMSLEDTGSLLPAWLGPSPPSRDTTGGAAAATVCYSCHDGYVVDSRAEAFRGHGHPVGLRPSEGMPRPDNLPVTSTGEIYCGTCHTPHSEATSERIDFSFFLRMRNDRSELCRQCHTRQLQGGRSHPVDKLVEGGLPEIFKRLGARVGKAEKAGEAGGTILCETCHRSHGAPHKPALRLSADSEELCGKCHPGKAAAADLREAPESRILAHRLGQRTPRGSIPAEVRDAGARLDARGGLTCLSCHSTHKAGAAEHLLLQENRESQFCLRCHPESQRIVGTPHDFAQSAPRMTNQDGQTARTGAGKCGMCHLAHGWAAPLGNERRSVAVCNGCHGSKGAATTKLKEAYSHSVDRPLEEAAHAANLPVFDERVHAEAGGRMACSTCHDSHGTRSKAGAAVPAIPDLLRRAEEDLCAACHPEQQRVVGSEHDMRRTAPGLTNTKGETVAQSGVCGPCHLVHDGRPPFGSARPVPADLGTPTEADDPARAACLGCHGAVDNVVHTKVGHAFEHPLGPVGDKGRPKTLPLVGPGGKLNLAAAAAGKATGAISCSTCHEPHARYESAGLLRMPARESQVCLDCHADTATLAGSPHDLLSTAPTARNVRGESAGEGGRCSACHIAHGGTGALLWAVAPNPAAGEDPAAQACVGCHREGGAGRPLGRAEHPSWLLVTTAALSPETSASVFLADPAGKRADQGHLTCRTCHNGHPRTQGVSAISPLLVRSAVVGPLCGGCHGREALRLFLGFHERRVVPRELGVAPHEIGHTTPASGPGPAR